MSQYLESVNVASYLAKETLEMELRTLRREDDPGLPGRAQCTHNGPYK